MIHKEVKTWRKVVLFRIKYGMTIGMVHYEDSTNEWSAVVRPPARSGYSVEQKGASRPGLHDHYGIILSMVFKNDKLELVK